ncbi:hypothetical protein [Lacinutrix sp. Bg11-31]|uniref:hypothetical protein n=1 Tax=Lacinutrix sp. Bg11-31 TaxID=2057808 RepID=UPI000C316767|nr:hypothetical protein [Lacinutrix sp. Bg11-31]AUC81195.1 hypothetical protein CW733_03220 [Lacinutrix sp. Bg11-31]
MNFPKKNHEFKKGIGTALSKNTLALLITLLLTLSSMAQNGINYKAVIKDGVGNIMESIPISVQFIVYEGSALTNNVYQESHTLNTDANGIIIVNIGEGITGDNFSTISWETDNHFLNVQVNIGAGLVDLGTTEFKTVPYALVAKDIENAIWETNGINAFYNAGNVGIGTNSPLTKLEILGSGTNSTSARITSPIGTSSLEFLHPDAAKTDWSIASGVTTNELQIGSSNDDLISGSVRLRLKQNGDITMAQNEGRIGIGTNTPVNPLSVLQSAGTANTVRVESLDHPTGKDLLELIVPSGSTSGSQFIEMQNGTNIVAAVNSDGSAKFKSVQFEDNSVQTKAALGPIAYGFVQNTGNTSSGSGNYSSAWVAANNRYEIAITGENYFWTLYTTNVTTTSSSVNRLRVNSAGGKLLVYLYNSAGTLIQGDFQFITYK